ncbi:MAG TPA: glycosyltransferase family 87 protein [Candidatus Brocadiia bacterium]|nr:glycosyltransferase family 87 protein [Candidatus Brocadiia bacterium]
MSLSTRARPSVFALAGCLLALAAFRLAVLSAQIVRDGMQIDFAAFYIAGRSESLGLNPYRNYPKHSPDIWFGIARRKHSRFLYPPFAATLFRPIAALPYARAKAVWAAVSMAGVAVGMLISAVFLGGRNAGRLVVAGLALMLLFHPTLILVERGQIDGFTFPLCAGAVVLMARGGGRRDAAAGALLALAVLLKLHVALIVPFLILRRKTRALAGLAAGIIAISILSLIFNGPDEIYDYIVVQMPRISYFEAGGTLEYWLPDKELAPLLVGIPEDYLRAEGRLYLINFFECIGCPSIAYAIYLGLLRMGTIVSLSLPSICVFAAIFALFVRHVRKGSGCCDPSAGGMSPIREFAWWYAVLAIILLSAPVTRVSNTVWLLPVGVLVMREYKTLRAGNPRILAALSAGILLVAIPDNRAGMGEISSSATVDFIFSAKYIAGELLILVGLMGYAESPDMTERMDDEDSQGRLAQHG